MQSNKREVKGISPDAVEILLRYNWPGNVRELENAVEHAVVFGLSDRIQLEELPEAILEYERGKAAVPLGYHGAVREAKRKIVLAAMLDAAGNPMEAAALLGLHVNNLYRLIRDLELKPPSEHRFARNVTSDA